MLNMQSNNIPESCAGNLQELSAEGMATPYFFHTPFADTQQVPARCYLKKTMKAPVKPLQKF
ncbi:hypothetical protein A8C56_15560 [Niabella ginsenosidivorans]|uniref:Uncharacterized protein n=1 Tax=Niabella ginsenosidivorans TaxID=1176587 RepID=A0A1A9I673_9BACT|nr:hypothetical protein A8C56_15560 [Niabella ginsenosidivorans]